MQLVSDSGRPLLAAAALGALLGGSVSRTVLGEAVVVLVPVNLVVEILKRSTNRGRPDGTHRRSNAAFPSSHVANAFAVAVLLSRRWRAGTPAFLALAALVACSRLYLDRHWLSDVVAGALLGAALGWISLRALAAWIARKRGPTAPAGVAAAR